MAATTHKTHANLLHGEESPLTHIPAELRIQGYFSENPGNINHTIAPLLTREVAILAAESALSYYGARLVEYIAFKGYLSGYEGFLQPAFIGINITRALWSQDPKFALHGALIPSLLPYSNLFHAALTAGTLLLETSEAIGKEYQMWKHQDGQIPLLENLPPEVSIIIKRRVAPPHYYPATITLLWPGLYRVTGSTSHEANQALLNLVRFGLRKGYMGVQLTLFQNRNKELVAAHQWLKEDGWLKKKRITISRSQSHQWWIDLPQIHAAPSPQDIQVADPLSASILNAITHGTHTLDINEDNIPIQIQDVDNRVLLSESGHFTVWMTPDYLKGLFLVAGRPMPGITLQANETGHLPDLNELKPFFSSPAIPTWASQIWPLFWKTTHMLVPVGAWNAGRRKQAALNYLNKLNFLLSLHPSTKRYTLHDIPTQKHLRLIQRDLNLIIHPDKHLIPAAEAAFRAINETSFRLMDAVGFGWRGAWFEKTFSQPNTVRAQLAITYKPPESVHH